VIEVIDQCVKGGERLLNTDQVLSDHQLNITQIT